MEHKGKLELTWVGKYDDKVLEPRILVEDREKSYGDPRSENMLIHGDNLIALQALQQDFYGSIKCIYIDPPYNTGSALVGQKYDDNLEHSTWLTLMRSRLVLLRELLCEEGTIWIQIDDEEQAYLKVLCDEVFGRGNFVNMISVNMKNIAGVSGGGEDKRLKKNCEYILIYAKDYSLLPLFNGPYTYTEISDLVQQYAEEGKSWKYTSVLVEPGEKEYYGSTVDGDGNEIKVYLRKNPVMMSIKQVATRDGITEKEAYQKYGISIFQTTNAQSSIRTRVMEYRAEKGISEDLISIEYVPRTGKNRGTVYEQFYKGDKCRLFVWLRDTSEVIDGELFKKDLQGTYWDMNAWMKNLTKEGSVEFGNGKKPEQLIRQIFEMTTEPGDWVLDSFLGSGTTAAVATKMGRKWVGIELRNHAYTHCKVRLDRVISGEDAGGITKAVGWEGGSGYHFYELAPSLLVKNERLPIYQINPEYTFEMLCEAICKIEGFKYKPDGVYHGHSSEKRFIHITKEFVNADYIRSITTTLGEDQSLLVYSTKVQSDLRLPDNIEVKRIPKDLLDKCTFESEVR
ncbi:site-specific DNA-methyltransferase [Anaerotignum sp.]|uniref:site-specific DNA-methyltransferase n=1 Tax=Anaerotignum sp. TaxID=2039241 RepID=UPI003735E421